MVARPRGRILPPRPFLDRIVLRVLIVWAVLHAFGAAGNQALSAAGLLVGGTFLESLAPTVPSFLWIAAVVVVVLRVQASRYNEGLFLANLGVSFRRTAALAIVLCAALDLALGLTLGALAPGTSVG